VNKLVALEANTPKGETLRAIRSEALITWAEQYLSKQDLLGAYEKCRLRNATIPYPMRPAAHPILGRARRCRQTTRPAKPAGERGT